MPWPSSGRGTPSFRKLWSLGIYLSTMAEDGDVLSQRLRRPDSEARGGSAARRSLGEDIPVLYQLRPLAVFVEPRVNMVAVIRQRERRAGAI